MENLSKFIDEYLNLEGLVAAGITIGLYCVLLTVRHYIVCHFQKKAELTQTKFDDLLIDIVRHVKKYFLFAFSLFLGLLWLKLDPKPRMIIEKVFIVIAMIQFAQLAGLIINFWLTHNIRARTTNDNEAASTLGLISFGVKAVVYTVILLVCLNNLGVDVTALVAGLGVGGVAVALALQNILTDLFSSLTIILDKPFIVGDSIRVGEYQGTIENIGLKTTRLRSLSGEQLVFGNGDLLQSRIQNFKRMLRKRVVQKIGVTYETSPDLLDEVPKIIEEIVRRQDRIDFDRCHLLNLMDSWVEFELVYNVNSGDFKDYADRAHRINIDILKAFAAKEINIAYPTQTVYMNRPRVDEALLSRVENLGLNPDAPNEWNQSN